jgi:hypothetical protein
MPDPQLPLRRRRHRLGGLVLIAVMIMEEIWRAVNDGTPIEIRP